MEIKIECLKAEDLPLEIYKKRLKENLNYEGIVNERKLDLFNITYLINTLKGKCLNCWNSQYEEQHKEKICEDESLVTTFKRIEEYHEDINSNLYSMTIDKIEELKIGYKSKRRGLIKEINNRLKDNINMEPPSKKEEFLQLERILINNLTIINEFEKNYIKDLRIINYNLNEEYNKLNELKKIPERRLKAITKIQKDTKKLIKCMGIEEINKLQLYLNYNYENKKSKDLLQDLITEATWLLLKYPKTNNWLWSKRIELPEKLVNEFGLEKKFENINKAYLYWEVDDPDQSDYVH